MVQSLLNGAQVLHLLAQDCLLDPAALQAQLDRLRLIDQLQLRVLRALPLPGLADERSDNLMDPLAGDFLVEAEHEFVIGVINGKDCLLFIVFVETGDPKMRDLQSLLGLLGFPRLVD